MCLAIEPMVSLGTPQTHVLADEWTVETDDGTWSAHWEHSVALTEEGPLVLTARDGGRAKLAEYGDRRPRRTRSPEAAPTACGSVSGITRVSRAYSPGLRLSGRLT